MSARRPLLAIGVLAVVAWAALAAHVARSATPTAFDAWCWARRDALDVIPRGVVRLGDAASVATVAVVLAVLLGVAAWRRGARALDVLAAVATPLAAGAAVFVAVEHTAKPLVGRTIGPAGAWAFPSGHAAGLCALAAAVWVAASPGRARAAVVGVLAAAAVLVGLVMARTYSHYPTDVLAGWPFGAAVGAAAALAVRHGARVVDRVLAPPPPPATVGSQSK